MGFIHTSKEVFVKCFERGYRTVEAGTKPYRIRMPYSIEKILKSMSGRRRLVTPALGPISTGVKSGAQLALESGPSTWLTPMIMIPILVWLVYLMTRRFRKVRSRDVRACGLLGGYSPVRRQQHNALENPPDFNS